MIDKVIYWIKFRWLWFVPIAISLMVTTIWFVETFYYQSYRITPLFKLNHPALKNLEISIQYPTSINSGDTGKNAKQAVIFLQSNPITSLLFSIDYKFKPDLDGGLIPDELRQVFESNAISLSQNVRISTEKKGSEWLLTDDANGQTYTMRKDDKKINIHNTSLDSIIIYFKAPFGVVNFLDKERERVPGYVKIAVGRKSVPMSIWLEYANTALTFPIEEVHIETFIIYSQLVNDIGSRVPSLDLHIKLESRWLSSLRSLARSIFGKIAPLSLIFILLSFSVRTYLTHKRIDPKYFDLLNYKASNRWDKAANACKEIIAIDPIYDNIQNIYRDVTKQEKLQNKRLLDLYIKAKSFYESRKWKEADKLLEEICSEKDDYIDTVDILTKVKGKLIQENEMKGLYHEGRHAELSNNIQEAIRCFRKIIAIDPDYEDASARLFSLNTLFSQKVVSDMSFLRRTLLEPKVGVQFLAASMDRSVSEISEGLLDVARDENVNVRRNLAKVVNQMSSPIAGRILHKFMEDPDEQVRAIALDGLEHPYELVRQLTDPDNWQEVGTKLIQHGEAAVEPLISALGEDWPIWERAMRILQVLGDVGTQKLNNALNDENPEIRERVAKILEAEHLGNIENDV